MGLKRILIIQTDDIYFLHETLHVLSANSRDLTDLETTILVSPKALENLKQTNIPLPGGITTDASQVLHAEYDYSFNLSLNETAWKIQSEVKAIQKAGAFFEKNELRVHGIWSTWFLTFKGNTPFVTFHMREIFRNILGLKKRSLEIESAQVAKTIIIGMASPEFFPRDEQEAFLSGLVRRFPGITVLDESEISLDQDMRGSLYVGPASLKALFFCDNGTRGLFISSRFQGLNLLPEKEGTLLITTNGKKMDAQSLLGILEAVMKDKEVRPESHMSMYRLSMENAFGAYLQNLFGHEDSYPFYQAHVVLWNYLLSLLDVNLDIASASESQLAVLDSQSEIVSKLLRLHDYAMLALDNFYKEAKSAETEADKLSVALTTVKEVDETLDKISATNPFLRPVLDFYKIRKGQMEGETLLERSQNSLLTYSEEHQALQALDELLRTIRNKK